MKQIVIWKSRLEYEAFRFCRLMIKQLIHSLMCNAKRVVYRAADLTISPQRLPLIPASTVKEADTHNRNWWCHMTMITSHGYVTWSTLHHMIMSHDCQTNKKSNHKFYLLSSFIHTWHLLIRFLRLPAFSVSGMGVLNCSFRSMVVNQKLNLLAK